MKQTREQIRSDRGASIFMLAISLFLLIGASAVAVDIGAIWLDRSTDQKVTDAAAAAGILAAYETSSQAACEAALTYVAVNTPDIDSVDTSGCASTFGGICDDLTPRELPPVSAGRYEITVTYPVEDGNDLMTSRIISRTEQPLVDDDGEPCERLGVKMISTRDSLFASVLGFNSGTTAVHTVAMRIVGDERPPLNLIVLDRTRCNAISVNGGGQIVATPVVDHDNGSLVPGLIIVDSDGSACSGSAGVINVSGAGSTIRADGPECGNGQPTYTFEGYTAQEGCGKIQVIPPNNPGPCSIPACSVSGGGNLPNPAPSPLGSPYTRAPADHRYNCYADYTSPPAGTLWAADALTTAIKQDISACQDTAEKDPYIYDLIEFVGPTGKPNSTFRFWSADLGHSCNPSGNITVNDTNVVVDCSPLQITSGAVTINNGNVVFNGNVRANDRLTINPPADDPWIFFRGGRLLKAGTGTVEFNNAMVYMAKGSELGLSGSSSGGSLTWTAPTSGPFSNLALWSDSAQSQSWSGQAALDLRGVFFMPRAPVTYSGGGVQDQTSAQWLAWTLNVGGGGVLKISPADGALPAVSDRSELIR